MHASNDFHEMLQSATAPSDPVAAMRAQMGAAPIASTKLADRLVMLSGPGGNVVALHGPDGKLVVDSFVQPAWPRAEVRARRSRWRSDQDPDRHPLALRSYRQATGISARPAPAFVAHVNTKARLTQPHDLMGMHFDPAPAESLPTDTFTDKRSLNMNGELCDAGARASGAHRHRYFHPLHEGETSSTWGDVFFNGTYPFIDASTGGSINGMIAGADRALAMTNARTKIVPGHGPLSDHAGLLTYPAGHCHDSRPRAGSQAVQENTRPGAGRQAQRPVRRQVGQGNDVAERLHRPCLQHALDQFPFVPQDDARDRTELDVEHRYVFARQRACAAGCRQQAARRRS